MDQKKLKICVGASAGGHMNQLLKLLEYSHKWPEEPAVYVTTMQELAGKLKKKNRPVYVLGECNRTTPFRILKVFWKGFRVVLKERPNVVISTGSLPIALLCIAAKCLKAKIIWIDSIANINRLSMSGRMVRRFADLFFTQWPDLADERKNIEYAGNLI